MRIHRLTAFHVPIALRRPVRHASHERSANDTLVVRCVLDDGSTGWGEGLPRTYVTGESIESAWRHLEQTSFAPLRDARFDSPAAAAATIDTFSLAALPPDSGVVARECFGNAVRCAGTGDSGRHLPLSRNSAGKPHPTTAAEHCICRLS